MATTYVIGDTHFGHANILNFRREDGSPMRPFSNVEEMDTHMIDCWNKVVRPQDHVYHLGDFAMRKEPIQAILPRLNGHKRLVRGNHDIYSTQWYIRWGFEEIYGVRVIADLILSHIPLHPESVKERWTNVHGHLHNNKPFDFLGPKYFNVSAEMIEYTPVTLEWVRAEIERRKK